VYIYESYRIAKLKQGYHFLDYPVGKQAMNFKYIIDYSDLR